MTSDSQTGTALRVDGLRVRFGGITAVDGLSFAVDRGEIVGVIGPNGAGKTTVFNAVSGFVRSYEGAIAIDGQAVGRRSPDQVVTLGLARTFQNIRLFRGLTVLENVLAGRHRGTRQSVADAILQTPRYRRSERLAAQQAERCLAFVGLKAPSATLAGGLAYGEQRRVEIARALATYPQLLLLDEPAAGMNPQESAELTALIRKVRDAGVTVVLVEHDMNVVMRVSDRVVVIDRGRLIASGTPREIQTNPQVIAAYLGSPPEELSG